jgi:uncharacterized membrane protein
MINPPPLPKGRLEALTDGIFAVTMTLLVLDLKFPEHPLRKETDLFEALAALAPKFDDYIISFLVLCLFWLSHLRVLSRVREADATFTWLNLGFLLFTTFVPLMTSLLGAHPAHPAAAVIYGANLLAILLFEGLLYRRMCKTLANETVSDPEALWRFARRRFLIAAGVVLLGVTAALVEIEVGESVGLASYVYLLLIAAGVFRPVYRIGPTPGIRRRED